MTALRDFATAFFGILSAGVLIVLLVLGVMKLSDLVNP